MTARRALLVLGLGLAVLVCGCRKDDTQLSETRGARFQPEAPSATAEPEAEEAEEEEPEPEPAPEPAAPRPAAAPPPEPEPEPVDERPEWQKIIDSQEPGMLMARRREPTSDGKPATAAATEEPKPQPGEEAKPGSKPDKPAEAPKPSGKGRTYCTWQYYASLRYLCTDLEPEEAKAKCDAKESAALGEPVSCSCVPAEGYAPQCLD